MPRIARIVVPGMPHHVTQRGNDRRDVFFSDEDRRAYLAILAKQCRTFGVAVLGYCLMTNHTHLVLVPSKADALAKAVGRTHWFYTRHVNRVHGRSGHLWQNRFYSSAMDDESCVLVMRYVECNPLRANLCRVARRYAWSSAAAHCGERATGATGATGATRASGASPSRGAASMRAGATADPSAMLDLRRWRELLADMDWSRELTREMPDADVNRVRRATKTGRPLADHRVVERLERQIGRPVQGNRVGRPSSTKGPATKRKATSRATGNR